jgi:hypothetical protein
MAPMLRVGAALALALLALAVCRHSSRAQALLASNAAAATRAGDLGSGTRRQRYRAMSGLLRLSENWAAKVRDKQLEGQLALSEAKLAELQSSAASATGDGQRQQTRSAEVHPDNIRDATALQQRKHLARAEEARDSLVLGNTFTEDEEKHALAHVKPAAPAHPIWATSAAGALKELKATLNQHRERRARSESDRIAREVQSLHREEQASLKKEAFQAQRAAALKREERLLSASLREPRASSSRVGPASVENSPYAVKDIIHFFKPPGQSAAMLESHAAASRGVEAVRARSLDKGATRQVEVVEDGSQHGDRLTAAPARGAKENRSGAFIVAPSPQEKRTRITRTHTVPERLNALQKSDSPPRKGMLVISDSENNALRQREGTYPTVTVGGIAHQEPARDPPLQCPQPMPTMLHDEMHAMLCWTLQLPASTCSAVWTTVPILASDTVGMALRRRVSSNAKMREAPTQVVFDVEEVQKGSTKGVNMGSMAAGFTYQGVGSAWEQRGQVIVQSSPFGRAWTDRVLGFSKGMVVEVSDCNAAPLARLTVYDDTLTADRADRAESRPALVATMSTGVGTEVAVIRSALVGLDGDKLGSLYQLVGEDGSSLGVMIEEGLAGAWLMQLERRQDVDIRAVAMLAATLSIAGQEQFSGFVVGLTVPLLFLLAALGIACCIRVSSSRRKTKHQVVYQEAYEALEGDASTDKRKGMQPRDTRTAIQPPEFPSLLDMLPGGANISASKRNAELTRAPREPVPKTGVVDPYAAALKDAFERGAPPPTPPEYPGADFRPEAAGRGSRWQSAQGGVQSDVWDGVDVPVGREPTAEEYQKIPLDFTHAERPPIVSGSTVQACKGVDEALAAGTHS